MHLHFRILVVTLRRRTPVSHQAKVDSWGNHPSSGWGINGVAQWCKGGPILGEDVTIGKLVWVERISQFT